MPTTAAPGEPLSRRTRAGSRRAARRRRIRRRVGLIAGIVGAVLLAAAVWVSIRALIVRDELESARSQISALQGDGDFAAAIDALGEHSRTAAEIAGDPVWRLFEFIPLAGDNLRAVRVSAEAVDVLANDLAAPIVGPEADAEASVLIRVLGAVEGSASRVSDVAAAVRAASGSSFLIGPVRDAIDEVEAITTPAADAVQLVPQLLGAGGAKSYLLVFQNNAESVGLGGSAASQTLVRVDNGALSLGAQASSASYDNGTAVDVPVDQSAIDLYSDYLVRYINTSVSRPDFPTAAQIARAFWQRDIDTSTPIDGVVSIDPLALQRILLATGPVTVGDVTISKENAVSTLLSEVYTWWDSYTDGDQVDAFFASVASSVFEKVSTGDFDLKDMAWAISESIDRGSIMMWSADEQVQSKIAPLRVSGILPQSNADATTVGVFFRDTSASKIDYYMDSSIDVSTTCQAGQTSFTVTAGLHLDISQADADALPRYVKSFSWGASQFRTEVFVYGPPGTTFVEAAVDARDAQVISTEIDDLGRPVAALAINLAPDESGAVSAVFAGEGTFAAAAVRSTPMVRSTQIAVSDSCGS